MQKQLIILRKTIQIISILTIVLLSTKSVVLAIEADSSLLKKDTDQLESMLLKYKGIERAKILNILSEKFLYKEPKKSLSYSKEAYKLAKGKNYTTEIYSIDLIQENYIFTKNQDSSLKYSSRGLDLAIEAKDTVRQMQFYTNKGYNLFTLGEVKKTAKLFSTALNLIQVYLPNHPNTKRIKSANYAALFNNLASVYGMLGYYDSAMLYYQKSLQFREKYANTIKGKAITNQNIGSLYCKTKNYEDAINYLTKAIDQYKEINDSLKTASCYNQMGIVYNGLNKKELAMSNFKISYKLNTLLNNNRGIASSTNNIAELYIQLKDYTKANQYLTIALSHNKDAKYKDLYAGTLHIFGQLYDKIGDSKRGIEFCLKSIESSKASGNREKLHKTYKLLSDLYEKAGNYKESLINYKLHKKIYDSIFNQQSQENYNQLQTEFETAQKEKDIIRLESEKKLQKEKQLRIIIVGSTILTTFILIIVLIYLKRKKDKQIHEQMELVHQKEAELAHEKLKRSKLKEEELKQTIQNKSKQLSTHALHMMQKNTMLRNVLEQIKSIHKTASAENKQELRNLRISLSQSFHTDKDWDVFKLYFEDINKTFYKKLETINPDLTTNDHRLCALIKLNMNSKEMASVLNLAPSSIKSSRHRLKKKLNLGTDVDMETFIRELG